MNEEDTDLFVLRLYVSGSTPRSLRAVQNLHVLCEQHLHARYELDVVDLYQQPERAATDQIVVTPTLVKEQPNPVRLLVGTLANAAVVLERLGLAA